MNSKFRPETNPVSGTHPRTLIVANYAPDRIRSMDGFANWLLQAMPHRGFEMSSMNPNAILGGKNNRGSKWLGYVDKFIIFPSVLRRASKRFDLVHIADQGNAMYGKYLKCPWGITVHDLLNVRAMEGDFDFWNLGPSGKILQKWIRTSLKLAKHVNCVSEATEADFRRLINPSGETETLIRNCLYRPLSRIDQQKANAILSGKGLSQLINRPFFLHVGSNDIYKNRPGFLSIAAALSQNPLFKDFDFVAAGQPFSADLERVAEIGALGTRLVKAENCSHELITALYSTAQALIFPSKAEGFGLPILEAMATGCPVFTTNLAPMTEVGGPAARYFDPEDHAGAARIITESWPDREDMTRKGIAQSQVFNEAKTSLGYAGWYRKILSS